MMPRLFVACLLAAWTSAGLFGCGGGPGDFANVNDRLRRENLDLRREAERLNGAIELRVAEIATLRRQIEGATSVVEGAEVPRATALQFGRYSGAMDEDKDGRDEKIRLFVQPVDQKGRFIPVGGRLVVRAVVIGPSEQPTVLAERTFGPVELDEAYRRGVLGAHFRVELPLPQSLPAGETQATVKAFLTDAATGVTLTHEQVVTIRRPSGSR